MKAPIYYRPSFLRHLHNLTISGFYTRELDADDFAFLESVKVRGSANGTVASDRMVLGEELSFWEYPYTIEPGVERRPGPLPKRIPETPEQREARLERSSAWRARRAIRKHDEAVAAAELERERQEWLKAEQTRKLRAVISDAEWEAAAPKRKFGKVVNRHYVPQWKLDETRRAKAEKKQTAKRAKLERAQRKLEQQAEQERAVQAALEQSRLRAEQVKAAQAAWERAEQAKAAWERAEQARLQAERTALEQSRIKADQAWATLDRIEQERRQEVSTRDLKQAILTVARRHASRVWTPKMLMPLVGCSNEELVRSCLHELIREGRARDVRKP